MLFGILPDKVPSFSMMRGITLVTVADLDKSGIGWYADSRMSAII